MWLSFKFEMIREINLDLIWPETAFLTSSLSSQKGGVSGLMRPHQRSHEMFDSQMDHRCRNEVRAMITKYNEKAQLKLNIKLPIIKNRFN